MRLKRSGVLGVAAVSVALVLSGCSGSDGTATGPTEAAPTTSAAPETSASPTPKPATSTSPAENIEPPVMPEEAKEFTAEGYEAFVNYWFDVHNYAYQTGESSLLREVSDSQCRFCMETSKVVDKLYADGGWQVGGEVSVSDFYSPMLELESGYVDAAFKLHQAEGMSYDSGGNPTPDLGGIPAFEHPFDFWADYKDGRWTAVLIEPAG